MIINKPFILIVISDENMRSILSEALQDHECPFNYDISASSQEARKLLLQKKFEAVVITKSVALSGDDGTDGLITSSMKLPPTITLLEASEGYPDYLYSVLTVNDWITIPFDLQELCNRVLTAINQAKNSKTIEIFTKIELIATFKDSNRRVINWFTEIPAKDFFIRQAEAWSASDNVDHLTKAHKPIAKALRLPKVTLRALFGKPDKPSIAYEELCKIYRDEIAKGAQASGRYLPNQENPFTNVEAKKRELLDQFSKASTELVSVLDKWNEKDLDNYLLPHPILGKLTIREMVYFTIYHNLRHASKEGD